MGISMNSYSDEKSTKDFNYEDAIKNFMFYLNDDTTFTQSDIIGDIVFDDIEKYIRYVAERIPACRVSEVTDAINKTMSDIINKTGNTKYHKELFRGFFSKEGLVKFIEVTPGCKSRCVKTCTSDYAKSLSPIKMEELVLEPEIMLERRKKNRDQDAYQEEQERANSYSEVNIVAVLYPTVWPKECLNKFSYTLKCTSSKMKEQLKLRIEMTLKDAGIEAEYSNSESSFSIIVVQAPIDDLGLLLDLKRNLSSDKAIILLDQDSLNPEQIETAKESLLKCKQLYLNMTHLLECVARVDPAKYKTLLDKLYSANKNLRQADDIYKLLPSSAKSDCKTKEEAVYKFLYSEYINRIKQDKLQQISSED